MPGNAVGAVISVIIIAVYYVVCFTISRRRKGSFDMEVERRGVVDTPLPPGEALRRIEAVASANGLRVEEVDAAGCRILLLPEGLGFMHFGYFFAVAVTSATGGGSTITVGLRNRIRGGVLGANSFRRRVMNRFLGQIRGALTTA